MEEIYSASVLTLVVVGGKVADSDLPGVFYWPRDLKTFPISLGNVALRTNFNPSKALLPGIHLEYSWLDISGTDVVNTTSLFHCMPGLTKL
jgi:hypothetical protein